MVCNRRALRDISGLSPHGIHQLHIARPPRRRSAQPAESEPSSHLAGSFAFLASRELQSGAKMPQIGMLTSTFDLHAGFEGFRQGLHDLGYMEGQSIALESRFAEGKVERLPALAARLVSLKVDVILATGVLAARAAHGTGLPLAPRSLQRSVTDICCLRASRIIDRCLSCVQPGLKRCASRPCFRHPARQGSGGRTAPPCVDAVAREQEEPPQGSGNVGITRRFLPEISHHIPDTNAIYSHIFPNISEVFCTIPAHQWWGNAPPSATHTEIRLCDS